jgi:AcrR family transcriptional regulator
MSAQPSVKSSSPSVVAGRRGRPRSPAARARVLRAARALVEIEGPAAVTIEALVARSGVSKPTIYRTWPNAHAVVMAALMESPVAPQDNRQARSALAALRRQLRDIAGTFASRTGRSVTQMLAAADPETELAKAFRHHFILARREEGRRMLAAAVATGELRQELDLDVTLDLLYGPIFFRILVGHAPADERFCERLLDQLVGGLVGGLATSRARTERVRSAIAKGR